MDRRVFDGYWRSKVAQPPTPESVQSPEQVPEEGTEQVETGDFNSAFRQTINLYIRKLDTMQIPATKTVKSEGATAYNRITTLFQQLVTDSIENPEAPTVQDGKTAAFTVLALLQQVQNALSEGI